MNRFVPGFQPKKSNEESQVLTGVKGAEFDSFQSIKFIDNGV